MSDYQLEAAKIAVAQRELDKRFKALLTRMHEDDEFEFAAETDYHPVLTRGAESAASLVNYIETHGKGVR